MTFRHEANFNFLGGFVSALGSADFASRLIGEVLMRNAVAFLQCNSSLALHCDRC